MFQGGWGKELFKGCGERRVVRWKARCERGVRADLVGCCRLRIVGIWRIKMLAVFSPREERLEKRWLIVSK